jgi:hypothetical protein
MFRSRRGWYLLFAAHLGGSGSALAAPKEDADKRHLPRAAGTTPEPPPPSATRQTLAVGAALVPGVIVHGSGSYVLGDTDTAKRLLLMEGGGLGLAVGSLSGLALTGAARSVAGLFIVTGMGGASLFCFSFAADLYRVASPPDGFGLPRRTPWFESDIGYVSIHDPVFDYRHFVSSGFRVQPGRIGFAFEAMHAPLQGNGRVRMEPNLRLWQAPNGPGGRVDGSFLEFKGGASLHRFDTERFSTDTYELSLHTRIDSERVLPGVRGAFGEFSAGYAWRETRFEDFGVANHDTLLLGGFGFGMYVGTPGGRGGELTLYYDHRHDDFAAGLKAEGLGSGVLGHFGLRSRFYVDERWGVTGSAEVGSALVLGLGLTFRVENGPTLGLY